MVKTHNVLMCIHNKSGLDMSYVEAWFDSGRTADGFSWPDQIDNDAEAKVLSYERDWSFTAGCSGYVTYQIGGTRITIAFSNPLVGVNKLGIGTTGRSVWDTMTNHNYDKWIETINLEDGTAVSFHCQCTAGDTNSCHVTILQTVK